MRERMADIICCRLVLLFLLMFFWQGEISSAHADYDDSVNLVEINPGFESGSQGWYTGGGVVDDSEASEGVRSGKLVSTGIGNHRDWRSQGYVNIESGKKYRLSFDYKTSSGAIGNPQVRFRFFNVSGIFLGEIQKTLVLTENSWQVVQIEATAPEDVANFDIFFSVSTFGDFAGSVWLDDVAVNPWVDMSYDYFPPDGTEGWSDKLNLAWNSADSDLMYIVYLGKDPEEVTEAQRTFLAGDIDYDGQVGIMDMNIFVQQWLAEENSTGTYSSDMNSSGDVNLLDLNFLSQNWAEANEQPAAFEAVTFTNSYKVGLELGQEYYWRVDRVTNGQVQAGQVMSFSCADYLDFGISAPTQIFYLDQGYLSTTQQVMVQSLQGLIARVKPALFIRTNGNRLWLDDLNSQYKVSKIDISAISSSKPVEWTLGHFSSYYNSYILCDAYNDTDSLTAAVCLAAVLPDSLVVDVNDLSLMDNLGVSMAYDARGHDEKWVWDQFGESFAKEAIFVQRNDISSHGAYLRDLPVALGALTWWHEDLEETEDVFSSFKANIPCFGWDSSVAPGEDNAITFHSNHNMYTVVTDWMLNLSLFAGTASMTPVVEFQQPCSDNKYVPEDNVHYVAFCMSDMDNVNTIFSADGWAQNSQRFGSQYRGQFAMGWGMPPVMMKIGPTVMKWWYDNAEETDCFIGYCSGLDYFHPSQFPELELHMSHLDKYLDQADLSTMCILDNYTGPLTSEAYTTGQLYSQLDSLRGMFLGYDSGGGKIVWFNGKPMVTGRYALWANRREGVCDTGVNLAASINALPANPYSEDGYTFVIVHAWSYGWDEVAECVSRLDSDVRVVTPNELIEQLYLHNVSQE